MENNLLMPASLFLMKFVKICLKKRKENEKTANNKQKEIEIENLKNNEYNLIKNNKKKI